MKKLIFNFIVLFVPIISFSQNKLGDSTFQDLINLDSVNHIGIFSNTYNDLILQKAKAHNISLPNNEDYPRVYFTNSNRKEYLKIWGGPDLGYSWFFVIGYMANHYSNDFGTFIDSLGVINFVVN